MKAIVAVLILLVSCASAEAARCRQRSVNAPSVAAAPAADHGCVCGPNCKCGPDCSCPKRSEVENAQANQSGVFVGGPRGNGVYFGGGACPGCRPKQQPQPQPGPEQLDPQVVPYNPDTAPKFDTKPGLQVAGLGIVTIVSLLAAAAGVYVGYKGGETVDLEDEAGEKVPALDEEADDDDDLVDILEVPATV